MARPTGITILSVLSFLLGVLMILAACGMFFVGARGMAAASDGRAMGGTVAALGAFGGGTLLILAVICVANGVGLWKLVAWGRLLTIVLVAIGVIFGLLGLFRAFVPPDRWLILVQLVWLAIDVWILAYMFKPQVKQAFGQ